EQDPKNPDRSNSTYVQFYRAISITHQRNTSSNITLHARTSACKTHARAWKPFPKDPET
ncbi:hypothetical protein K0M31_000497, partial [Melipona bicolor]